MNQQPRVSIVMPTYNRIEFLPATVESVFDQTLSAWELLIADDGSDSETLSYLEGLTTDPRVRLLCLEHKGNPSIARNAALRVANSPLIAFLDSDDLWEPDKLKRQLALLDASSSCGWSYTAFIIVDEVNNILPSEKTRPWTPYDGDIFRETVRTSASIRPSSVIARTDLLRETGPFDEAMDCSEDYDLWARFALRSPVSLLDEPLTRVRRHAGNSCREPGYAHSARDYSLKKLEQIVPAERRVIVTEERSRNAIAKAYDLTNHRLYLQSLKTIHASADFSWRYPWWWFRASKSIARTILAGCRNLVA